MASLVVDEREGADGGRSRGTWVRAAISFGLLASKLFKAKAVLALLTLAAQSWVWTPEIAVVILAGLVFHEYGHVWAMRASGIPTKGFYLIPFVGGVAIPERAFASRGEEAFVAAMGPVFGLAATPVAFAVGWLVGGSPERAAALAGMHVGVNLFNLLPIVPLDGGRMVRSVVASFSKTGGFLLICAGVVASLYLAYELSAPLLTFVAFIGAMEAASHLYSKEPVEALKPLRALAWLAAWLALVAVSVGLVIGCEAVTGSDFFLRLLRED